ncbi:hypothetical protein Afil01_40910 [Actinorhabdospora filicis]|uniref:Uncharacterized protein n=1 Tax=Actinorhabdospora filicis TaxID=1785913 RepID=A0A9W6SNU3_9ACTN|nr:DUF6886 family protein [Actinorhabdospora filicis]GLZ79284.1 hypothetical protein Afil01_40910 [Actinorhabdospora filicis]
MRPEPGQVLHFSEDPTITRFEPVPHPVSAEGVVWAVDAHHAPDYWFPRDCPRVIARAEPGSAPADTDRFLGPGVTRAHAVEYAWLEAIRTVRLYAYRLPAETFDYVHADRHAMVSAAPVTPLGPAEPVGDLFAVHEAAGVPLLVLPRLEAHWAALRASTLGWGGIRLRNALGAPF